MYKILKLIEEFKTLLKLNKTPDKFAQSIANNIKNVRKCCYDVKVNTLEIPIQYEEMEPAAIAFPPQSQRAAVGDDAMYN